LRWLVRLAALLGALAVAHAAVLPEPAGTPPGRLGYWSFDTPDWQGDGGRMPLASTNARPAPSFIGRALGLAATNPVAFVRYPLVDSAGGTNLSLRQGAVRFFHHPVWASSIRTTGPRWIPPGSIVPPPGRWVRLFAAGYQTGNRFVEQLALAVDPAGTNLAFLVRDDRGTVRTNLQVNPGWVAIGGGSSGQRPETQWHELVLNYSPTACALILDGQYERDWLTGAWDGTGVPALTAPPGALPCFTLGSDLAGTAGSTGRFDELETFDRPITPLRTRSLQQAAALEAAVTTNPPSVRLQWASAGHFAHTVRRRPIGAEDWTVVGRGLTNCNFLDTNTDLTLGSTYEYSMDGKSIWVALDRPPIEDRGRVVLLVDDTLAGALAPSLEQFQSDLAGDGWTIVRHDVPRQDDHAWDNAPVSPAYKANVARIKSLVRAESNLDPARTRAVVIVGHATIPYSGDGAEDGHPNHNGAWPADNYYGDVDGNWTDSAVTTLPTVVDPAARNVPGDGKFDPFAFERLNAPGASPRPQGVELAVGRIDFARLPAFAPRSELDLLRLYFDKNHRYRHAQLRFEPRVLVAGFFGNPFHNETQVLYDNALLLGTRLFGLDGPGLDDGNIFALDAQPLWALTGGYGGNDALHNNPDFNRGFGIRRITTADLANPTHAPGAGFYMLKGSYFGDWNLADNNFLRAILAPPDSGLAAVWTRFTVWSFEPTAVGEPLATALLATARAQASVRTTSLLGDPTLRLFVTPPPTQLTAARDGAQVRLRWTAVAEPVDGYQVLRSARGPEDRFLRLNTNALVTTTFVDPTPLASRSFYQVRALRRIVTGSGTFFNSSQAASVAIE
jgi:hypothetical protein